MNYAEMCEQALNSTCSSANRADKVLTTIEANMVLAAMLKHSGENYATVSQNALSRTSNLTPTPQLRSIATAAPLAVNLPLISTPPVSRIS